MNRLASFATVLAVCACLQAAPSWALNARSVAVDQTVVKAVPEPSASQPEPEAPSGPGRSKMSWGTGFAVAPEYLLTAHHVIGSHNRVLVGPLGKTASGRPLWVAAQVIKSDPEKDLALLKISQSIPALALSAQGNHPPGLEAAVIGFPQPRLQGNTAKITLGVITGYRISSNPRPAPQMQISAEVFSGNSGGPVFALDGTVIGMVQRKVTATRVSDLPVEPVNSITLALDSSELVKFLSDTPAQVLLKDVALDKVLRPYLIYQQSLPSILAVVGLSSTRTSP